MHNFCALLLLLVILVNLINIGTGQSHAFIQVDNELKYLVDGVPVSMNGVIHGGEPDQGLETIYDDRIISKNYMIFDPPFLDFKEHPTGMPQTKKVYIVNSSPEISIHLHSLSGNTMHFHCTFFQDKIINPGGNTSFDVVFLGREEGFIENTIYIHTSIGTYRYWVKAVGTSNPYRVRPLIGVKMPLNSSYTPILHVHNPHSEDLQIVEIYSTGGDLHLELADGMQGGEMENWSIAPFQTKAIMKATFVARRETNHTAYIRIVPKEPITDYMVIPVEVEVSSEQGLFFPLDTLHFGHLTQNDPPVSVPLFLLNSAPKHIHIQNIITSTVNDAITIDFKPVKIPPGTVHPTQVATVTFDPSKVSNGVKVSGKLLVKSKVSAYKLSVPFSIDLYKGSLLYNSSVTRFYSGSVLTVNATLEKLFTSSSLDTDEVAAASSFSSDPVINNDPHDLILKNTFKFPIVVYNITVPDEVSPHFKVVWNGPVMIKNGLSKKVAEMSLLSFHSDICHTVKIIVHTNVTSITIPLIAYNGRLTKYIPPSGKANVLDFGTLGMGEEKDNYFYVLNENPVDILLKGWASTLLRSTVELMGIVKGNFSNIGRNPNRTYSTKTLLLKPNHYAVFRIGILTPEDEGIYVAEAYIKTQYEVIIVPFRLRTADGLLSIFPETVVLDAFPGKLSEQDIYILSTFSHSMTVEGISPQSADGRFSFVSSASCSQQPILHPSVQSHIGLITFNPRASCGDECYTGFSLTSKVGQQWAGTFALTSPAVDLDGSLLTNHRERFANLDSHSFNMSLFLDTSEVKGYKFNAKINLVWPSLVPFRDIKFPLTQVLNSSYKDLHLTNPASQPVIAQVLFLHDYPSPQSILFTLQEKLRFERNISWDESMNLESFAEVFSFVDLDKGAVCSGEGSNLGPHCNADPSLSNFFSQHRRTFESEFKTRVAKDSLLLFLEPHSKMKVRLAFTPSYEKPFSTLILIRNNLTVMEAVSVRGSGARGHINFKKTFHFSVQEKNLKNCSLPTRLLQEQSSLYTLHQTFFAENDGLLPVHIYRLRIGDSPCQSYGFKVINCTNFILMPNESRKIEIAFTPDFSLFHVEQLLIVSTSLTSPSSQTQRKDNVTIDPNGNLYLKLIATISPHAVAKCGEKIPRPPWEPLLYYSLVTVLVAMLLGTLIRAYLESEHILKSSFVPMTTVVPAREPIPDFDRSKVFDLRSLALRDEAEPMGNGSISDSGDAAHNKVTSPDLAYVKIKNHLNSVGNLKKQLPNNNNNNNASYTANKSKLNKVSEPEPCAKNYDNLSKKSENRKNDVPIGLSTFLSSLPFGLKGRGAKCSETHFTRNRKDSQKENERPKSKPPREDEFSSTTTESSSADEICVYIKDNFINYKEKPLKKKNVKSTDFVSPEKNSLSCQNSETGFEITTKCKGVKKIKETSSKNICNAIELPYTLKTNKMTNYQDERNSQTKKVKQHQLQQQKVVFGETRNSFSSLKKDEASNTSPKLKRQPPVRAVIAPSARPPLPPIIQPLAPRDPSYSSVVLGNTKQKSKVTPVGKIVPEVKRMEKPLGPVGQKLPVNANGGYLAPIGVPSSMAPSHSVFPPQEWLHALPASSPLINAVPAVSSHSWDPRTLSAPSVTGLGLDSIRTHPIALSDDDWLPFGGPSFPVWGENDAHLREKPNPPQPTLWESLPSFSIWSSPWGISDSVASSVVSQPSTLWQSGNSYGISPRMNQMGNYDLKSDMKNLTSDNLRFGEDKNA